jgi:hypothetical protein
MQWDANSANSCVSRRPITGGMEGRYARIGYRQVAQRQFHLPYVKRDARAEVANPLVEAPLGQGLPGRIRSKPEPVVGPPRETHLPSGYPMSKHQKPISIRLGGRHDGRDAIEIMAKVGWPARTPERIQELVNQGLGSIQDDCRRPIDRTQCIPRSERSRCCAQARSTGKPRPAPGTGRGGRCRRHGGASTGPRTADGLERLRKEIRQRWRRWCIKRGLPVG